jgi:hypothetical protein
MSSPEGATRECWYCGLELFSDLFSANHSICKVCKNKRQREQSTCKWKAKMESLYKWLCGYKEDKGCTDCLTRYPHYVMHFDHLRDKKFNLSAYRAVRGITLEMLQEEVAKCEVVCANCHAVRTWKRLQENPHPRKRKRENPEE